MFMCMCDRCVFALAANNGGKNNRATSTTVANAKQTETTNKIIKIIITTAQYRALNSQQRSCDCGNRALAISIDQKHHYYCCFISHNTIKTRLSDELNVLPNDEWR